MSLHSLKTRLDAALNRIEREKGIQDALIARLEATEAARSDAEALSYAYEEASKLLAQFADERQAEIITAIENIASVGLSQVFDEPMKLKIVQTVRARRVEIDFSVITGDLETPILEARGGGLAAVAGFLIRVAVLLLKPDARRIMALDETFAMLSEEFVPRMAEFLSELCEQVGLQMIMVTHQPEFAEAADRVYRIEKSGLNTSKLVLEK